MSSHSSHGMPRYMCDDILRGSPYGLDFSVMAKDWVIVAPPCWSTSTIPAGCATVISARLTIPGRVGPVARHIGPQDHRVVDVTTEMHGRAARGLRAVRRPAQRGRPALDRISDPGELRVVAQRTGERRP